MPDKEVNTINLALTSMDELFTEPDYDPFEPATRYRSGFDELVSEVRALSMKKSLSLRLNLSSQDDERATEDEVKKALHRHCAEKIAECEREIRGLLNQGKRDLVWAVTLSVIFFLAAYFVYQLPLPEFVIYLISTGFGLLAWVVLWPPLDNILYEWKPCRRSQQIYQYIQSADIEIN